ncbi:glycerol transporter|uniref:Glycerol transporter n=1 Tax=Leuconostoc lactis TaxID=1246 RepID=A0A6L7AC68_LEULA|nr:glycerol transporter [Leuconostoc lactis]
MLLAAFIIVALPITGGALNPARALSPVIFVKGNALGHVWVYVVADLLGGVLAAFAANYLNKDVDSATVTQALSGQKMTVQQFVDIAGLGQTNFANGQALTAFMFELVLTFLFVLVILIVTKSASVPAPLVIGLALTGGIYAFAQISGAHFNPAVSLAMAIQKRLSWLEFVGYVIAQLLGALVASLAVYGGISAYLKSLI